MKAIEAKFINLLTRRSDARKALDDAWKRLAADDSKISEPFMDFVVAQANLIDKQQALIKAQALFIQALRLKFTYET